MQDSCIKITLDVRETSSQAVVRTKQGDTARQLWIDLADGGKPYEIGPDCFAVFTAGKPDGTKICNDCIIENNRIFYPFTLQTCNVPGRVEAEVKLYGADQKVLTSARFLLEVVPPLVSESDTVTSETQMDALDALILETTQLKAEVEQKLEEGAFVGPQGAKGDTGENGITPHIGTNGNWYLGQTDTGMPSRGVEGAPGKDGQKGEKGDTGEAGVSITEAALNEDDTLTLTWSDGKQYTSPSLRGEKGDRGEQGAQGEPGLDGRDGDHGSQIIKVTDGKVMIPYTTVQSNGFKPAYRTTLESILNESGAATVRVGDVIWSGYYHYPVGCVNAGFVYLGERVSLRGATGASGGIDVTGATPGQMILVREVDEEGRPTAWETVSAFSDVESGGEEILPQCSPAFEEDSGFYLGRKLNISLGNDYVVSWNGTDYTCTAGLTDIEGESVVAMGNAVMFGNEDTGEPFLIVLAPDSLAQETGVYTMILPLDGSTELTLKVATPVSTQRKLDNRYLNVDWLPTSRKGTCILEEVYICDNDKLENSPFGLVSVGAPVDVLHDGVWYTCTVFGDTDNQIIGNMAVIWDESEGYPDTGEPFCIVLTADYTVVRYADGGWHLLEMYDPAGEGSFYNRLPPTMAPSGMILAGNLTSRLKLASDGLAPIVLNEDGELRIDDTALILRTSTEGSVKRFRITVNNTGTLAVTEV